jgi:hypothetical protein
MAPRTNSMRLDDPYPEVVPPALTLVKGESDEMGPDSTSFEDGALKIEHPDGSVTIDLNPPDEKDDGPETTEFDRNLALKMSDDELSSIASTLIEGIDRDNQSRSKWLETRALGISLLGLELEKPRAGAGSESAPIEGISTVRHPILLEATVSFQATARAELLPASGPVKVRNDAPSPPKEVVQQTSAQQQLIESMQSQDELAQALEKDLNHYLTVTATEYVPDTDRMLFYVGFGGDGFKKVYNCPLRRRPVSESIDAEDLIISNTTTDIQNSGRITHRIKMRPSVLKRMQIMGVNRDVDLSPPAITTTSPVDKKMEAISGVTEANKLPEDRDYEVYETYCELDLDEFAPKGLKGKGLPLPYRVTIEKDSRKILDLRRNWQEDDEQALAKQFFVQFPFIRGLGFYGIGFIHLLGNTANALTAGWREALDAGMFANFPGFIYSKGLGRQLSNQFRIPPGGGIGLDVGPGQRIQDSVMPVPYKEAGAGFISLLTHIEETGRRLASTAEVSVGEGKQDAPVGTTLALIEQASKVMDSAHKRLHASQAEEFKLLKCRFKEDPEALWRHNKKTTIKWKKDQFIQALDDCELVPVADPNNPTSLHRLAKGAIIKQLQAANPALYDEVAVDMRVMRISDIDPAGLFKASPTPPPPDPRMVAIQEKAKAQGQMSQIQLLETRIKAATAAQAIQDKAQDRASREKIEGMKIQLEGLKIKEEQLIHAHDAEKDIISKMHEMNMEHQAHQLELHKGVVEKAQELQHSDLDKSQELHHNDMAKAQELRHSQIDTMHSAATNQAQSDHDRQLSRQKHDAEMSRANAKHEQDMAHAREMHAAKLEAAKQMAKVKPKAKKT